MFVLHMVCLFLGFLVNRQLCTQLIQLRIGKGISVVLKVPLVTLFMINHIYMFLLPIVYI